MKRLCLMAVVGGLALTACGGGNIEGTSWTLETLDGGAILTGSAINLSFSSDTARGSGGCNEYFGGYETSGDSISFGPLASTERSCGQGLDQQEVAYLAALQSAEAYQVSGDRLEISHSGGTLVFAATAAS